MSVERYRVFKNVSDIEDALRQLISQQTVLIGQLQELINVLRQGAAPALAYGPSGLSMPAVPSQVIAHAIVAMVSQPVQMVDSEKLVLTPDKAYRYELADSDLVTVISLDDNLFFGPRQFTEDRGAFPVPARALLMIRRPVSWTEIWLRPETAQSRVYVAEWRYVKE